MNLPDVVLVVRQMITVWNYDYIVDVEIHQTGVIKSQVTANICANIPKMYAWCMGAKKPSTLHRVKKLLCSPDYFGICIGDDKKSLLL